MVASRVLSCAPSAPNDLRPYCLSRRPPASLTSNSANLRVPAPKSTARNDFVFSICLETQPGLVSPPMWFRIEGNPSWLLEMFTAVNRKTNGRNKKNSKHQHPTREHPSAKRPNLIRGEIGFLDKFSELLQILMLDAGA